MFAALDQKVEGYEAGAVHLPRCKDENLFLALK